MNKLKSILFILGMVILLGCEMVTTTTNSSSSEITTSTNITTQQTDTTTVVTTEPLSEIELYYNSAFGLEGDELKSALHNIIDDHTEIDYSQVWEALKDTDEDPNNPNNVILFYSGRSQSKDTHGGGANDWNREHVWAKSHGKFDEDDKGPGTDVHHLRPTDASVNSTRGNLDFDNGGNRTYTECILRDCVYDSDSWEPDDEVKGDVARMLFYMAVRYEGDSGELDLELNEQVNNGSNPYFGRLSVLLEWHELDPVDDFEQRRNEIIYSDYQHNRNPFIDYPEFASLIWDENK